MCDLPSHLHLHLFNEQSSNKSEPLGKCSMFRSLFGSIIFLHISLFMTATSLLVSSCLCSPSPYAYLLLLLATGVVSPPFCVFPGVELNLGRLSVTEWLMCRVLPAPPKRVQTILAGWEPVGIWLFFFVVFFRCCFIKPPTKAHTHSLCAVHITKHWAQNVHLARMWLIHSLWKSSSRYD